ncbi:MAG: hypothetical protein JXA69_18725 [Phycisphaerae bacterium]|nr:hypothetical protein [Phycisphaerae bacterium]
MKKMSMSMVIGLACVSALLAESPTVTFDAAGIVRIDGKPFFPVGLFTYHLDTQVLAELHELQFNTIINGFEHNQLDLIHAHGLKAICFTQDEWFEAAHEHPALLAWYLTDEPEGHDKTPEDERERYLALKRKDSKHPIGLCHFLFEALEQYEHACDFTMTDVYPVTANRDVPLVNVGIHMDEARRVHGANWPNWTYIQDFGGPDTDGGKWAQPLPHEVRCMTYIALVHRATGILYFSYWPKAPQTWNSLGPLNREIHRLVPWLVAEGKELPAKVSAEAVQVRARKVASGGVILAVNTRPVFTRVDIAVADVPADALTMLFVNRSVPVANGVFRERFGPYEAKVYTWGTEPAVTLAGDE